MTSSKSFFKSLNTTEKVLSDLKKDLEDVNYNIDKANQELLKLKHIPEIEEKAKQLTLEKLNKTK